LSNLGNSLVECGRIADAFARYKQGLELAARLEDHRVGVKLLYDLGAAYAALAAAGDPQERAEQQRTCLQLAAEHTKQGSKLADESGDQEGKQYALLFENVLACSFGSS
jgi:hypothetical protein